jgi:hypothetical protein
MTAGRALLVMLAVIAAPARGQGTEPQPSPSPPEQKPRPKRAARLVLDVDKHADQVVEDEAKNGPPRFQESVDVYARSPQVFIERFFGGPELDCGPSGGGPPTTAEMAPFRPHTSPTADLLSLAALLLQQAHSVLPKGPVKPRFYLYKVTTAERARYELREDRIPDSWLFNLKNTTYELTDWFTDRDSAVKAWRKYEHDAVAPAAAASPPPAWLVAPCRARH